MNKFKKFALTVAAFGTTALALAEDTVDTSVLDTTLASVQTAMKGYVEKALPIIGAIIVAGLAIWALPKIVSWIKRGLPGR